YMDVGNLYKGAVPLSDILDKALRLVKPRIPSNIKLEVKSSAKQKRKQVCVDVEQFIAVILELIKNAITALRSRGGAIELGIKEMPVNMGFDIDQGEFDIK